MRVRKEFDSIITRDLAFPESPRWHAGRLWFVDMHRHNVWSSDEYGHAEVVFNLPGDRTSAIGFLPDGEMLVLSSRDRVLLQVRDGTATPYVDLSGVPGNDFNDMVVDGQARVYIGNRFRRDYPATSEPAYSPEGIVFVSADRRFGLAADNVFSPNGSVVTPDGETLIVAQSRSHRIVRFTIRADGSLVDRALFADTSSSLGVGVAGLDPSPDGICLDAEGGVWFGSPRTHEFRRVIDGGEVTDIVPLGENVRGLACVLGGAARKTLFMATAVATDGGDEWTNERERQSTATGSILAMHVDVPGVGWP